MVRAKEISIHQRHLFKLVIGLIITIVCLAIALWGIEWEQIKEGFQQANYFTLPILMGLPRPYAGVFSFNL
jgi:uncharacterized membrane protein YcjF (UPF0283 family)